MLFIKILQQNVLYRTFHTYNMHIKFYQNYITDSCHRNNRSYRDQFQYLNISVPINVRHNTLKHYTYTYQMEGYRTIRLPNVAFVLVSRFPLHVSIFILNFSSILFLIFLLFLLPSFCYCITFFYYFLFFLFRIYFCLAFFFSFFLD